jgi:hypothetical protein
MEEILKNSTEPSIWARMCLNFSMRGSKEGNCLARSLALPYLICFCFYFYFYIFVWGIRAFQQWLDRMGVGKAM